VTRLDQRQGFLVSTVVHLVVLTALWSKPPSVPRPRIPLPEPEVPRVSQRVFLPPPAVLRQLRQAPPPTPPPRPQPTPPPEPAKKDRMSIGPPSEQRQKGPLLLRREDDLTKTAKGLPDAVPSAQPPAPPATPSPAATARPESDTTGQTGRPGLVLPPSLSGRTPAGEGGGSPRPSASAPSIASSLRNLDRRLQTEGTRGVPTGSTVQQIGAFAFDPEGADFTLWIQHLKTEVYRNWILPTPALWGQRGHVDLEFTVERDGTLKDVKMLKSSGTPALDRAAQNALLGSRPLPLPSDFAPDRLQIQVTFFYNEGPQGS
jgi:TonB family protein